MSVQWGDVPGEVSAIATIFALAFAAVAAVAARRTFQIESDRDRVNSAARRAQEVFARRAQAGLVSAWWEESRDGLHWGAYVRNASEAPIYQVYVTIVDPADSAGGKKLHFPLISPSEEARFFPVAMLAGHNEADPGDFRVKLSFTDAAGVRWTRSQYGQFAEMEPSLRIRADEQRATVFAQFKDDFKATYGVAVEFDSSFDRYPQSRFTAEVQTETPSVDALVAPHDWIGDLARRKVIEPAMLSADQLGLIPAWARSALTFDGRLFGLPVTTDTVALIRNTALAPLAPATFDDLIESGQALCEAGRVDEVFAVRVGQEGDPFQIWPLFASAGGWLFGQTAEGGWDSTKIGIASPESVAAFDKLRDLGEAGLGILRRSMGRTEAFDLFSKGRTAYLLTTSDGLWHARRSGLPIAVSAIPPFVDGAPAMGFTLVHGLLLLARGANNAIAQDLFADYLTHRHVMATLSTSIDSAIALQGVVAQDPSIRLYQQQCEISKLMPSLPQMDQVWRALGLAEVQIIAGADAEVTAQRTAARLEEIFAL